MRHMTKHYLSSWNLEYMLILIICWYKMPMRDAASGGGVGMHRRDGVVAARRPLRLERRPANRIGNRQEDFSTTVARPSQRKFLRLALLVSLMDTRQRLQSLG